MAFPRDISRVFEQALGEDPNRPAVTTRSGTVTYAELEALANQSARALREHGVKPGDRVAASLPNDIDILIAFHGAMRVGAIWVGINKALAPSEKEYILRDSGTSLFLCDAATAGEMQDRRESLTDVRSIVIGADNTSDDWRSALEVQAPDPVQAAIDPHAPAAIAYTSGTTGYPKGVVHSQYNLLAPGAHLVATRQYNEDLRKGDCFPLTIINVVALTTLLTSQARGLGVIMENLSADNVTDWIRRERVTVWNGPPAVLYTMAHDERIRPSDLQSLREVWSGGADCPETIRNAFESKFGVEIRGTYGLTEAPTVVTIEVPGAPHIAGSSGLPLPHLEVTIRDTDGQALPPGEVGEICVGVRDSAEIGGRLMADWGGQDGGALPLYRQMLGYWKKPDESGAVLRGGVLHTGDVGALDPAGNLIVSDRLNLVLNRGGANVYPAEIERVVVQFSPVDSCAALGLPDERLGQRIGLLVQFKPGQDHDIDALVQHCRAELAHYKVPEFVAAVDSLPRNVMGKIDRRAITEVGQRVLTGARRIPAGVTPARDG
jgi:long-chain acyl-CoA synthetase